MIVSPLTEPQPELVALRRANYQRDLPRNLFLASALRANEHVVNSVATAKNTAADTSQGNTGRKTTA
ncbi:MAG: hypothetical protein NNC24_02210 [Candidatus Nanosynbacter sp. P11B_S7_bin.28.1]|nr:hypothetical protein [Candidatus Nanosynbacter sp. P11B_S7_bin.28.1]